MTQPRPLVAVVDDDVSVRRGLERLLRSAGYAVESFASAAAFLTRADHEPADCLVLDVTMPGTSGIELQTVLVAKGYDVPIVIITGHGDVPMASQVLKMGAHAFFGKPFDDDVFLDVIRRATTAHRERRTNPA